MGALAILLPLSITAPLPAQTSAKAKPAKETFEGEQQWRTFFSEAKLAYEEKRWAEAKSLYLKASAIKVTPKILGNLAQVEIQLGEYRAAAMHATEALAEPGKSPGSVEDLAIASKYVGKLTIGANVEGATVKIDGEDLGVVTAGKVYFVDPGMRKIEVSKEGYLPTGKELVTQKGSEQHVDFELATDPGPKATPTASNDPIQPKPPAQTLGSTKPFEEPRPEPAKPSPIVLIAGGAVAAGGIVTGFVFNSKASSSGDKAESLRNEFGPTGCSSSGSVGAADCDSLLSARKEHDKFRNISTAGFIVGSTALVATAVYWLWPRRAVSTNASNLRVVGSTTTTGSWLGVSGSF